MKRIRSFTLLELVITLLISSFVIGFTYYAFLFFRKQYNIQSTSQADYSEIYLLKKLITKDIQDARNILDTMDRSILIKNKSGEIVYTAGLNNVVRQAFGKEDSFYIKSASFAVGYLNDSVKLVDHIILKYKLGRMALESRFVKVYSAAELLETEINVHERID
jgi:hypothetical protein